MKRPLTLILLLFSSCTVNSEEIYGRIVGITDGDTVKLLSPSKALYRIRLSGIDAPESMQAFGLRSKQTLSDCSYNKEARVIAYKLDRYARTVGKVLVNGVDCNLRQIELGMAWHYKKYEREQELEDRSKYAQAEYLAQKAHIGLWSVG